MLYKKLIDFQEQWIKLVDKAYNDFNSLSKEERVWYTVQILMDATNNGGMISFFYNSGADYYIETINDLKELKQDKIAELLERIGKMYYKNIVPKDIEKRNQIIISIPDDGRYDQELDEIDTIFYQLENKLEEDLVNYISTKILVKNNR